MSVPAHGSDDLDSAQDNPPGCTTATSESQDGCGAQGREHFGSALHRPPIEACRTQRSDETGSVITRVLPPGPLRGDGSLAFISGMCVYLPPNYEDGTMKYPVLYLLHGGGGDQGNWVTMGRVRDVLDGAYAADPNSAIIALMPDGRSGQWHDYYDRRFLMESYVVDHVVPYADSHFRTIPDRNGRAIVGLSNGGYGAMHFAAKRPDMFRVAGSMSGNLGARSMGNLGTPVFPGGPAFQEAGTYYYGNVPAELATNLDHVGLILDWGASCSGDLFVDLCLTWGAEQAFRGDNQHFRNRLTDAGHGDLDYREAEGSHAWRWWTRWLSERHLPFALARLVDPMPVDGVIPVSVTPTVFRFRSIKPQFSVWGYEVKVDAGRPSEFLEMVDVTAGGMTVRGSGGVTIRTGPRYKKSDKYLVTGTGLSEQRVKADKVGRLEFRMDLGPPHPDEQYAAGGRVGEARGDYWVTRNVVISTA